MSIDSNIYKTAYAIDAASSFAAALCLSPFVAIVDRAVVEKSADKTKNIFRLAFNNLKRLKTAPKQFFTEPIFFVVFGVYCSTYIAANTIQSYCVFAEKDPTYCNYYILKLNIIKYYILNIKY